MQQPNKPKPSAIKGALFGHIVGDALGVPVEFSSRIQLEQKPVVNMRGYGTHDQPPGTWSDDASLMLCLVESLTGDFSLDDLSKRFVRWFDEGYPSAHGHIFDVGIATRQAIGRLRAGHLPAQAGLADEHNNGNGSLMRILPLAFYPPATDRLLLIRDVSSLTHRHIRSVAACVLYVEYARLLLNGLNKHIAYQQLCADGPQWLDRLLAPQAEQSRFERILDGTLPTLQPDDIRGSGYVLHALEASLWCLLTTSTYAEAVLQAVNLGEDTDTTGAITGGLAGLYYGFEQIPKNWLDTLANRALLRRLIEPFVAQFGEENP